MAAHSDIGRRLRGAATLAASLFVATPADAALDPVVAELGGSLTARSASSYWTPERMRSTAPIELARDALFAGPGAIGSGKVRFKTRELRNTSAEPNRLHGKIFGEFAGIGAYSCSGTVIASGSRNLVTTAGHCLYDAGGSEKFASNLAFVPGYRDGESPFGVWPAATGITTGEWAKHAALDFDASFIQLQPDLLGAPVEDVIGARGVGFNQDRKQRYAAYGYPAAPAKKYDGEALIRCTSRSVLDFSHSRQPSVGLGCDMKQGSSGGGWVIQKTFVVSSISHGHPPQIKDVSFGPYYGNAIKALYTAKEPGYPSTLPYTCGGKVGTLIATDHGEKIRGTERDDVIVARGGADRISSGAGKDIICAGEGNDRISSGDGRDRILGGPGDDSCKGGAGTTKKKACER